MLDRRLRSGLQVLNATHIRRQDTRGFRRVYLGQLAVAQLRGNLRLQQRIRSR
jgi:hypothetical protein